MYATLKLFFGAERTRPWLVLTCLLLAGLAEALSISTLLPVANALIDPSGTPTGINAIVRNLLGKLGIPPTFESLIAIVVGLLLVKSILMFGALSYAGITSSKVSINLRRRLIKAVFEAKWSFYAGQSAGRFANAISNDATRASDAYLNAANAAASFVQMLAYILAASLINWRTALIGIVAAAILGSLQNVLIRSSRRAGYKQTDRVSLLTADMADMLNNIKALKSMDRYGPMVEHLSVLLQRIKRNLVSLSLSKVGIDQGSDAATAIVVGLCAFAAQRYLNASLPELLVTGLAFFQIVKSVTKLQKYVQTVAQIESAYTRTHQLINDAEANRELHGGTKTPNIASGCSFRGVSFSHAEHPVISNANIDIPTNQITVLQGPSGAGKTTIIDLLVGLNKVQSGQILVGEDSIDAIDIKAWRKSIGYVPQDLMLFHDTVRENIILGIESITDGQIDEALTQAGAKEFVMQLSDGIDTDVGSMGGKLSGGQRQRIALARALVTNPQMLILDEVTSALDPDSEAEIVNNIAGLRGRYTIVAITHRPAWTAIADKLYSVNKGHVALIKDKSGRKTKQAALHD